MTVTSLVAVQSNIHPGPDKPGQVISATWRGFVQGPTSARSQDQPDDATICASFAGEFVRGRERLGCDTPAAS